MTALLALIVIWSIVAMALWCCYRLWYWAPTATSAAAEAPAAAERESSQAA